MHAVTSYKRNHIIPPIHHKNDVALYLQMAAPTDMIISAVIVCFSFSNSAAGRIIVTLYRNLCKNKTYKESKLSKVTHLVCFFCYVNPFRRKVFPARGPWPRTLRPPLRRRNCNASLVIPGESAQCPLEEGGADPENPSCPRDDDDADTIS